MINCSLCSWRSTSRLAVLPTGTDGRAETREERDVRVLHVWYLWPISVRYFDKPQKRRVETHILEVIRRETDVCTSCLISDLMWYLSIKPRAWLVSEYWHHCKRSVNNWIRWSILSIISVDQLNQYSFAGRRSISHHCCRSGCSYESLTEIICADD